MSRELVGDSSNQAVYPITSVSGVFDENNKDLKTILIDLKKSIDSKADGSTPTSTNFIPVVISQQNVSKPSMPTGGSYDYLTKTLTPPNGWTEGGTISTNTYISMGVANADTKTVKWSEPYNSLSIKGDKGDKGEKGEKGDKGDKGDTGSGGGTTDEVVMLFAYKHSDSKPNAPTNASYDSSTKKLTLTGGWQDTTSGLEKPIYLSIGTWHSKDSSIEWQDPFLVFGDTNDLPFDDVPQSNYATTFCYKDGDVVQTEAPKGGTYNWENHHLDTPPDGWENSKEAVTAPFYMSIGNVKKDKDTGNTTIDWSLPIYLISKDSLNQGPTPGTDNLVVSHVVMCYQNSSSTPATPSASDGSVDFTQDPYVVTPPSGWKLGDDESITITDDTWVTIKAFYYKADDSGTNIYEAENNTRTWSDPVHHKDAVVTLSKEELDLVVGKMSITANEIKAAAKKVVIEVKTLDEIATHITSKSDFYSQVAGEINIQALNYKAIADNITIVGSQSFNTLIQSTTGEVIAGLKADKDGMMEAFAQNLILKAKEDANSDSKGSVVQLLAEKTSGEVAAQLAVGINTKTGKSYIKEIADNIDVTSEKYKLTVANAIKGNFATYIAEPGVVSTIVGSINDDGTGTGLISQIKQTPSLIDLIAKNINIEGTLTTKDIYIGGKKNSVFNADGSGYVANKNISWDKEGNTTIKGNINALSLQVHSKDVLFTSENYTYSISDDRLPYMYNIISDTTSSSNTALFVLPDSTKYDGQILRIAVVKYNLNAFNNGIRFRPADNQVTYVHSKVEAATKWYVDASNKGSVSNPSVKVASDNSFSTHATFKLDWGNIYEFIAVDDGWVLTNGAVTLI